MLRRETHATDREGGREWLLGRLAPLVREWHADLAFDAAGSTSAAP
jgi:hypothetical protein